MKRESKEVAASSGEGFGAREAFFRAVANLNAFGDAIGVDWSDKELLTSAGSRPLYSAVEAQHLLDVARVNKGEVQSEAERKLDDLAARHAPLPKKVLRDFAEAYFLIALLVHEGVHPEESVDALKRAHSIELVSFNLIGWLNGFRTAINAEARVIDVEKLAEGRAAELRSEQARRAALERYKKDDRGTAMRAVRRYFDRWEENPDLYPNPTAFARDMLEKFKELRSERVLTNKVREWRTSGSVGAE